MKCLFARIFLPIAVWICSIHCAQDSDYAHPRILILGTTGVGKSSLASVLAGCAPGDCLFPVCTSINSCTKNTSIVQAKFIGNFSGPGGLSYAGNLTIVDTPGFGDGDLEEPKLVGEMVHVLKEDLKWANLIVLCFDRIRWDAQTNAMLETLQTLFGENLWRNTIIEVTKWAFDEKNIQDRKRRGITEEDTLLAINNQLNKNFHLNHSLPGVFLDSLAVYYPEDEVQTRFFRKYSAMLWEAAKDRKPFSFDAVGQVQDGRTKACGIDIDCCDDLTNEINDVKSSITKLNHDLTLKIQDNTMHIGIITNNIHTNTQNIGTNTQNIGSNTQNIGTNTQNIGSNTQNIGTNTQNIGTNTHNIGSNTDKIDTNTDNIGSNTDKIDTNTDDIATNKETISTLTETTSRFVSYCGYREMTTSTGTVTYEKLVTDQTSFSLGGLDIGTGVFTAPTRGTYLVTQNFMTAGAGDFRVYINKNGHDLDEGRSGSRSLDEDRDMTGRTLTIELATNDKLYLHVNRNDDSIAYITFCITLLK